MIVSTLETCVTNRKQELISEIIELEMSSRLGVVDGWANIAPHTRRRLDEWIAR